MSRKSVGLGIAALALLLLVLFGGRVAGAVEDWLLALHGRPPRSEEPAAEEAGDEWPDTPAGTLARGWVEAFSRGEEAMRAYLLDCTSEAALAERPMAERMASYRNLRTRYGTLMLASVAESAARELTAVLLADDASAHRFLFTVEEDDPHKLAMVGIIRHGHGHGSP